VAARPTPWRGTTPHGAILAAGTARHDDEGAPSFHVTANGHPRPATRIDRDNVISAFRMWLPDQCHTMLRPAADQLHRDQPLTAHGSAVNVRQAPIRKLPKT